MSFHVGNQIIQLSGSIPELQLQGTETGGISVSIRENAGVVEIYNILDGTTITTLGINSLLQNLTTSGVITINNGTIQSGSTIVSSTTLTPSQSNERIIVGSPTENSAITLPIASSGLSYHFVGNSISSYTWQINTSNPTSTMIFKPNGSGGEPIVLDFSPYLSYDIYCDGSNWYIISTTNLHIENNYLTINTSGITEASGASVYGTGSSIAPSEGYYSLMPQLITATIGGTVGTSETITAQPTIVYNNSTSSIVLSAQSLTAGATGDLIWDLTSIAESYVSGGKILNVSIAASSSASSTSATVACNVKGQQFV